MNPERVAVGVAVGEEVMTRHHRIQAHRLIPGRDIQAGEEMEHRKGGDLGFGQGFWAARLRGIWRAIEEGDSSPKRGGVASGLGAAGGTMMEIQEGVQVEARLAPGAVLDMRAQGSDRRQEDSACIVRTYLASDLSRLN